MTTLIRQGKLDKDSTSLQCKLCSAKFKLKGSLVRHIKRVHSTSKPFSCSKCSYATKSRPDLKKHIDAVHDKLCPHPCIFCDKPFFNMGKLNNHLFTHTRERPHSCLECDSSFAERHNLERHVKTAHMKISPGIKCPGCPKYVPNEEIYQEHQAKHALEKRHCDICGKSFSSEFTLGLHMTRIHADRVVECEFCSKRFPNQKHYKIHVVCHGSRSSVCPICGKSFVTKENMREHIKKVHEPRKYECEFCHKTFSTGSDARNHQIRVHAEIPEEIKQFQCSTCEKRYFFKQDLARHEAYHGTSRPFKCEVCKKCFRFKGDLTHHKKLMHDPTFKRKIRLHMCPHCLKGLRTRFTLRQHIARLHLGEPPRFSCIFCGATATTRSGLFIHIRRCIGENPYFCEECDYSTVSNSELRRHFRQKHTNERPFKCDPSC